MSIRDLVNRFYQSTTAGWSHHSLRKKLYSKWSDLDRVSPHTPRETVSEELSSPMAGFKKSDLNPFFLYGGIRFQQNTRLRIIPTFSNKKNSTMNCEIWIGCHRTLREFTRVRIKTKKNLIRIHFFCMVESDFSKTPGFRESDFFQQKKTLLYIE